MLTYFLFVTTILNNIVYLFGVSNYCILIARLYKYNSNATVIFLVLNSYLNKLMKPSWILILHTVYF